jgi:DNA-directed RNA polymerase specialized sigma24 family protein
MIRESTFGLQAADRVTEPAPQQSFPERLSQKRLIDEALLKLSPILRIPLVLSDMDGFKLREIAEMLSISLSAAKMRITEWRG